MTATDLTGRRQREFCRCGEEIKTMIFRGSGFCSVVCRKHFGVTIDDRITEKKKSGKKKSKKGR